jgi:hypothetical protein
MTHYPREMTVIQGTAVQLPPGTDGRRRRRSLLSQNSNSDRCIPPWCLDKVELEKVELEKVELRRLTMVSSTVA